MIEEKLEYKPIPVKDLLRDLKNLSWLMTNLAFSAIIYGEKSLAEEVLELEKRVTYLEYLLIMQSSLATRNPRDAEKMVSIIKLAESIGRISNAAADIAYTSLRYPSIKELTTPSTGIGEVLARVIIPQDFNKVKLEDLYKATDVVVDVIALRRGRNIILEPPMNFVLIEGDALLIKGSPDAVNTFIKFLGAKQLPVYEGKSDIGDSLLKLRDITLTMVDMSYVSLLTSSEDLAEYVASLEDYVDAFTTNLQEKIIEINGIEPRTKAALIKIVVAMEELADGAANIVEPVLAGLEPHPIITDVLWETFERISVVEMDEEDEGKTLKELGYQRKGITVLAIRRGDEWIVMPPYSTFKVKSGDILIVKYASESEEFVEELEKEEDREEIIEEIREEEIEEE